MVYRKEKDFYNPKKDHNQESRSKITLKDYIYTTELASKKAKIKARESRNEILKEEPEKKKLEKKLSTLTDNYRS